MALLRDGVGCAVHLDGEGFPTSPARSYKAMHLS